MLSRAGAGSLYSPDLPTEIFGRYFTFFARKRPFFPAPVLTERRRYVRLHCRLPPTTFQPTPDYVPTSAYFHVR